MAYVFKSMELDDEDKHDMAVPCTAVSEKKLTPEYPWGLRIYLSEKELAKLNLDASAAMVGGMVHGHFMACVTSVSQEQREGSESSERIELQIQQLCIESEDEENKEADEDTPRQRARRLMYKEN